MEFDPFSTEFFEDPWEVFQWLREEAPAYHNEEIGFWALSRYDDCAEAHRDVATYTSTRGLSLDQLTSTDFHHVVRGSDMMILMDPPDHERMRKLVNRAFTPRRIAEWEPVVRSVIDEVLDPLTGADSFDAVVDFAGPFPVEVICTIVGVPKADRQQIRHWTDASLEREVGNPFPTTAGIEATIANGQYMLALVADKRRAPSDDMIGHLIEAEVERSDGHRDHLTDHEIASFINLLTSAGSETVTKLVGNGVMAFADHPDELAQLQADPGLAAGAVEEVLRWRAPSQYQGRYSLRDRDWHGVTIPAGNPVLLITGAANRDPRTYDDPDRFDIDREAPLGISFGHGIHYCIGAHLARLEGKVAFTELYRRWPALDVDLDGVEWVHMSNVAGPSRVPVTSGGTP
jgi:cytochrome P450